MVNTERRQPGFLKVICIHCLHFQSLLVCKHLSFFFSFSPHSVVTYFFLFTLNNEK